MKARNRTSPRLYDEDFKRRAVEMTLSGRGPTEVARDLGIPRQLPHQMEACVPGVGRFGRSAGIAQAQRAGCGDQAADQGERLHPRAERDSKKNYRHNGGAASVGREQMRELCVEHGVSIVCRTLELSRSGHYARAEAGPSPRRLEDERLKRIILRVHRDCFRVYGYPRIRLELRRLGVRLSRRRAARLMLELGIRGVCRGKFKPSGTDSRHGYGYAPNLLGELDIVESPHQVWVSDTTYIRTAQGWAYLAVTMDLGTRYIAGWSVSVRNDSELTATAARKALARFGSARPMHHSDRGSTYASWEFQQAIAELERSMSRKGNCYDNAAMESFFGTLKAETGCCGAFATADELASALFVYIESFYNTRRIHTSLGKSPLEALKEHGPSSPSCSQGACGDSSPTESSAPHEQLGLDSSNDISNN